MDYNSFCIFIWSSPFSWMLLSCASTGFITQDYNWHIRLGFSAFCRNSTEKGYTQAEAFNFHEKYFQPPTTKSSRSQISNPPCCLYAECLYENYRRDGVVFMKSWCPLIEHFPCIGLTQFQLKLPVFDRDTHYVQTAFTQRYVERLGRLKGNVVHFKAKNRIFGHLCANSCCGFKLLISRYCEFTKVDRVKYRQIRTLKSRNILCCCVAIFTVKQW